MEVLGRGMAWLDTGTHDSLLDASSYIATIEKRQGLNEEIALDNGFINISQFVKLIEPMGKSSYEEYLRGILNRKTRPSNHNEIIAILPHSCL